jgi:hypothetical protein
MWCLKVSLLFFAKVFNSPAGAHTVLHAFILLMMAIEGFFNTLLLQAEVQRTSLCCLVLTFCHIWKHVAHFLWSQKGTLGSEGRERLHFMPLASVLFVDVCSIFFRYWHTAHHSGIGSLLLFDLFFSVHRSFWDTEESWRELNSRKESLPCVTLQPLNVAVKLTRTLSVK